MLAKLSSRPITVFGSEGFLQRHWSKNRKVLVSLGCRGFHISNAE